MSRLKGLVSDGTHNDKIETYKRFVKMLSSYKLLDDEHLSGMMTKTDVGIDNGNNGSVNKRRRSIRIHRPNYQYQAPKVGNQLSILADLFNQNQ